MEGWFRVFPVLDRPGRQYALGWSLNDTTIGVCLASTVTKLLDKGLIEEAGRLDLPGKPVAFQVTDTFLRVFGLGSLADLPPLHGEAAESAEPEETEGDDGQLEWK